MGLLGIGAVLLIMAASAESKIAAKECLSRDYGFGGTVCVCNSERCDRLGLIDKVEKDSFLTYTSNLAGLRLERQLGAFNSLADLDVQVALIDSAKTYQEIIGFGGAFTDSTGINILSLDEELQEEIMSGYFSEDGLQYNLCRVPMASTDFSLNPYTYHDQEDVTLSNFSLAAEDYEYKIPLMKWALSLNKDLQFFTSTWVAPLWMKSNGAYAGPLSFLKEEMYQVWANYFVKFLDAYKKENITYWGLTTSNEPNTGLMPVAIPGVGWYSSQMLVWIRDNLGPTIRSSAHKDIKIMTHDDQRAALPTWVDEVFSNETAFNYTDGIAVHWYTDSTASPDNLNQTHEKYPDKFILGTEACAGFDGPPHVALGSWERGENYASDIIEDLNHWVTGWVDWNMVLNTEGGPTYISNFVDSPIIVNSTAGEFYRQPMYYALAHFTKFLPRGSLKIYASQVDDSVPLTAFKRSDGGVVVILLNTKEETVPLVISDKSRGNITLELSSHSITTLVYW